MKRLSIFCLLVFLTLGSCSDDTVSSKKVLVSSVSFLSRSANELKLFIEQSDLDVPTDAIEFDVEIFHVTYRTQYKGEEIIASGVVILPDASTASMLSFQHGTIAAHSQAPTALPLNSGELIYYSALSTLGMITCVPDLLGFGSSNDIMHPYYVEEYTAGAVIDLLKAAQELAIIKGIEFNEKLFLAGYSQGGYATMAAHKFIEENELPGFDLVASFPAAGGYDIKGVQEFFFEQETYDQPFYMAYVARSYQTAYDWTQPLSDFFQEPYAGRIPDLFDGSNSGSAINAQLTTTVADLVSADLLANIDTDPDYEYITNAFEENSVFDWTPTIKMFMYHGDDDITVPYQNSVDVYNHFIGQGASPDIVKFITVDGDHGSGFEPYAEDFIPKLIALNSAE